MAQFVEEMVCLNAHYNVLWGFIGNKVYVIYVSFLQQLDLKNKNIHRYNYTDSALMG